MCHTQNLNLVKFHNLTTFSDFGISKFENLWGSSFFKKISKFPLNFKNPSKFFEKVFCFCDNWIWIGIVKLYLTRTGYFSSAANVLTRSPRFGMSIRETFKNSIGLSVVKEYDKSAVMQMSSVLWRVYHVACRRVLWNRIFRHLSDHVFGVRNFGNTTSITGNLFDQNVQNLS